jgi:hypothetical protein
MRSLRTVCGTDRREFYDLRLGNGVRYGCLLYGHRTGNGPQLLFRDCEFRDTDDSPRKLGGGGVVKNSIYGNEVWANPLICVILPIIFTHYAGAVPWG